MYADALALVGAGLGVVAVVVAIAVPLFVEWSGRPSLRIERGADANRQDPLWRIVHVQVVDEPLRGWRARYLLRNPAAGCQVRMEFVSKSDGSRVEARGKWSAQAEPFAIVPISPGTFGRVFDQEKIARGLTLDVSPSSEGTGVAVAIKHNGDSDAYAFDPEVYAHGNLRNPAFALPHEEYEVTVTATAGEITAKRRFLLSNAGTQYRDLHLEPLD